MTLDWHVEVLNAPLEKRANKKKTGRRVVIQNTFFIALTPLELLSALDYRTKEAQPVVSIYES
ncbi:hypothetical protein BN2476_500193 [Paraburkholderia piptadeniae]|uniref:Uncharacterized protein n=1 Tax=Paraburkholderia piptadeniae TaxID=1701573 RepID=A0A1N7SHD0_9BURK|nr:hypothetical protein [Paraburkholderia piptadeniae]SIT46379.1 hypothetical protein BN2476_500193 [Paraburkholderia piptadeniae]